MIANRQLLNPAITRSSIVRVLEPDLTDILSAIQINARAVQVRPVILAEIENDIGQVFLAQQVL